MNAGIPGTVKMQFLKFKITYKTQDDSGNLKGPSISISTLEIVKLFVKTCSMGRRDRAVSGACERSNACLT